MCFVCETKQKKICHFLNKTYTYTVFILVKKKNIYFLYTILKCSCVCPQTETDFKKESLDRIDNEMMQAKRALVDITETRRLCLQELGLRKNFVMWVKEALEGE